MKFGIQLASYPADTDPTEELERISQRARLAAKYNFEALFVSQHYLTGPDTAAFQSLPLLAYPGWASTRNISRDIDLSSSSPPSGHGR